MVICTFGLLFAHLGLPVRRFFPRNLWQPVAKEYEQKKLASAAISKLEN
jgi:hypothetical protein